MGLHVAAVAEFFKIVGEQDVPDEKIPARLIEVATHFAQTRDVLAALEPDDPKAAALAASAKQALDGGRLAEADRLLDQAKEIELAALRQAREFKQKAQQAEDRHALNAAKLVSGQGSIALTQLRYRDAAQHFKNAAELVPASLPDEVASYLHSQAGALYREGDERGDNAALKQSIEVWRLVLDKRTRERVPLDWAVTQNNLGNALRTAWRARERHGAAGGGGRRLSRGADGEDARARAARVGDDAEQSRRRAAEARRARERHGAAGGGGCRLSRGAEERTRERVPLDWARTQNNLGNALMLGERESGTARLEEAVAAYRAALKEWTRERVPLQWAMTQNNLGNALRALGERESGTARLEEAVAAYRAALEERTRERVPLQWAMTQNNLGTALRGSASGRAARRGWRRRSPPIARR